MVWFSPCILHLLKRNEIMGEGEYKDKDICN